MHIDTHTKEAMISSTCEVFGVYESELLNQLRIIRDASEDDRDYENKLNGFIIERAVIAPSEILLFHFSRRLHGTEDDVAGRTLVELITTPNAFSDILGKHGLQFIRGEQHIDVIYKGKLVDWDKCCKGNSSYIRSRLGYYKGREDFCFNGFAFKDLIYKNNYARDLSGVPEFVGSLIGHLECKSLGYDFMENSTYYCYEYKLPLKLVMFDNHDKYSYQQKWCYLVRRVLMRIARYQTNEARDMFDHDNLILRLKDDFTVPPKYYIGRERITSDML